MVKWILAGPYVDLNRDWISQFFCLGFSTCKAQIISLSFFPGNTDHDIRQWYENVLNTVNPPYPGIHADWEKGLSQCFTG